MKFLHHRVLGDFVTPIEEILQLMDEPLTFLTGETATTSLKKTAVTK